MTEFVVRMANRPGMLASLTETLAAAGINIDALAAYGVDDEGIVRLVVD
ncbi:MAG TPA: ACT domain-containing protein [Acidimicrobiia bacterium]|nr:ACT domain-containing protein [Acidimicrobiia bacterium]